MCNMLHKDKDYQPIPKTGEAWKLFGLSNTDCIPLAASGNYKKAKTGWIKWSHEVAGTTTYYTRKEKQLCGFCAFETLKEARAAFNHLRKSGGAIFNRHNGQVVIKKVLYTKGIGMCTSTELDSQPRRFVFFKRFKIVD